MSEAVNLSLLKKKQTAFFSSNFTKITSNRIAVLKKLRQILKEEESTIFDALKRDLQKPEFEALASEILLVNKEINMMIKKLNAWSKPRKVPGSLINFPSKNYLLPEPYGNVLIISPWNFPFQLTMIPVIGAIAAGNTVVVKPSESSPNTSRVILKIIEKVFSKTWVSVVEGDATAAKKLLQLKWDYIFFTGSTAVGKIVAKAAAINLTPVTLELGGKSPCIVDETAPIQQTAKRIVWGKFTNCGQICIAPNHIIVHHKVKDRLVQAIIKEIENAFGKSIEQSKDYGRIIHKTHFKKLKKSLQNETLIYSGKLDEASLFFHPTLVDEPRLDSNLMKEEIFGPILPILSYQDTEDISKIILSFKNPLAFYVFSKRKKFIKQLMFEYSFGSSVVNDVLVQFANHHLPFGGVGESGMGAYHGKHSFELFSHSKAIVKRYFQLDIPQRYAPYPKSLKLLSFILKKL